MSDVTLYLGDCLEYMKSMPDKSVDAIITDLPYGTTACSWDEIIPFEPMWEQVKRIDKGVFITTASQPFTTDLINSNRDMFRYEWIWHKNHPTGYGNSNKMPMKSHENILIFYEHLPIFNKIKEVRDANNNTFDRYKYKLSKGTGNGINQKTCKHQRPNIIDIFLRNPTSVKYFKSVPRVYLQHPTEKPVELYDYLIHTYTNLHDTVLDICMGSGTTGVACVQLGRNFIGCEIDPTYYAIAEKRIKQAQAQMIMEL